LGDLKPLSLDGAHQRFGRCISEEELLLRLTMPAEQVDAMIAAHGHAAPMPAARPGRAPLVNLLRELSQRPSITHFSLVKDGDTVVWRRAN